MGRKSGVPRKVSGGISGGFSGITPRLAVGLCGLLLASGVAADPVPAAERQVLIELYQATGGDDWHDNENWLGPEGTECTWFGVVCARFEPPPHPILELRLSHNNLTGALPDSLGDLDTANRLELAGNRLSGALSADLLMGEGLWTLDLRDNQLSGPLPELDAVSGVQVLLLDNNRLTGSIPESWSHLEALHSLSLGGNLLEGPFPEVLGELENLRGASLANNFLEGPLPDFLSELELLRVLSLAENRFSGPIPDSFADMNLSVLDLRGNLLSGDAGPAFEAFSGRRLLLGDNDFTGQVPASIIDLQGQLIEVDEDGTGGGLDFCFTDISVPDQVADFVDAHHLGGSLAGCQGRSAAAIDPTFSGTWYQPDRSGEGLSQMFLPTGEMLVFWFGFDWQGRQAFHYNNLPSRINRVAMDPLHSTRDGEFAQGFSISGGNDRGGRIWINRITPNRQHVLQHYHRQSRFCFGGMCIDIPYTQSLRTDMVQLTRLAGSTCDHQAPHQEFSGLWYDPERSGEGFIVEAIENDRGVIYWFTYQPDGSGEQVWMTGDGTFDGSTLHIDHVIQPAGRFFGEDFDPDAIERVPWGEIEIAFNDDDTAQVSWDSVLPGYGSGSYPLTRLARPQLADCD